jgi:hypothetical protein
MKRLLILLWASWVAHATVVAATGGPSLRFLAERAPDNLGNVVLAAGDQLTPPFALSSQRLSDPLIAPGRKLALRLCDKPIVLAQIALPENGDSFIILLIPDPRGGYLPVVINASDVNFRGGDVYFYNHTPKPVIGYVGTTKFFLDPEEGKLLRPAGAKDETYYDVGFGVREAAGDRVMRTLRWPVLTRSRSYVFFYQNVVKNRIDFRAVDEFVAPAETQGSP